MRPVAALRAGGLVQLSVFFTLFFGGKMPIRREAAKKIYTLFYTIHRKAKKRVLHSFFTLISPRSGGGKFTLFFLHHFGEILNTLFFKNNRKIHRKQLLHSIFYTLFAAKRRKFLHLFCYTLSQRSGELF